MIKIEIENRGGVNFPKRELTTKEKATVTSQLCNGIEYIYYQGDEPTKDIVNEDVYEDTGKINISTVDINTLTEEQVLQLKTRLGL